MVRLAIENGIYVLVEKSFATSTAINRELLETPFESECSESREGRRIGSVQSSLSVAAHPGQIVAHRLNLKFRD